jgi:hypothetical protein
MIKRYISFFKKTDEEYAGKIPINIDINILQEKYNNIIYDPLLIYSYPIKPEDEYFFLQFIDNYKFDFLKFDYFLECYEEK